MKNKKKVVRKKNWWHANNLPSIVADFFIELFYDFELDQVGSAIASLQIQFKARSGFIKNAWLQLSSPAFIIILLVFFFHHLPDSLIFDSSKISFFHLHFSFSFQYFQHFLGLFYHLLNYFSTTVIILVYTEHQLLILCSVFRAIF